MIRYPVFSVTRLRIHAQEPGHHPHRPANVSYLCSKRESKPMVFVILQYMAKHRSYIYEHSYNNALSLHLLVRPIVQQQQPRPFLSTSTLRHLVPRISTRPGGLHGFITCIGLCQPWVSYHCGDVALVG